MTSPVGGPPPPNDPHDDDTRPEVGPDPEVSEPLADDDPRNPNRKIDVGLEDDE